MDCAARIHITASYLHGSQRLEHTYIDRAFGIRSETIFLTVNFDGKIFFHETEGEASNVTGQHVPIHQIENGLHNADVAFGQISCDVFVCAIFAVNPRNSIQILKGIEFDIGEPLRIVTEYPSDKSTEQTSQERSDKCSNRSKRTEDECADIGADIRTYLLRIGIEITYIVGENCPRNTPERREHGTRDAQIPSISGNNIVTDFDDSSLRRACNKCCELGVHIEQIG